MESLDVDPSRISALQSLCKIFEQINKHPEELNFRKIRKNHPAFHQDIGRHKGGIELLIAAGFRPTLVPATKDNDGGNSSSTGANANPNSSDEINNNQNDGEEREQQPLISCLISKEPNLEHDMDGWMAWFDLNKATLEILRTRLHKVSPSGRK